jgi:DNA repair ATPase RecN
MGDLLYADVQRLRNHQMIIREERDIARRLCETLTETKRFASTSQIVELNRMLRKAEQLERFFAELNQWCENTDMELERFSREFGKRLEECTYQQWRMMKRINK